MTPKGIRRVLLVACLALLAGCGPRYVSKWDELRPGMTRAEVEALLGPATARFRIDQPGGTFLRDWWQYGDSDSTSPGRSIAVAPPDDIFVVSFGEDGTVSGFRRPTSGRQAD